MVMVQLQAASTLDSQRLVMGLLPRRQNVSRKILESWIHATFMNHGISSNISAGCEMNQQAVAWLACAVSERRSQQYTLEPKYPISSQVQPIDDCSGTCQLRKLVSDSWKKTSQPSTLSQVAQGHEEGLWLRKISRSWCASCSVSSSGRSSAEADACM